MLLLAYALWIGPTHWPISLNHAILMLYEMAVETAVLWGLIITGMVQRWKRR